MTNEQIKDIKLALECCADEVDGCPKCPYARKNSKDGIAHCRQASLEALQLINEYEQRIAQLESELLRYQCGGDKRIALTNETRKNTAYDFLSSFSKFKDLSPEACQIFNEMSAIYGVEVK